MASVAASRGLLLAIQPVGRFVSRRPGSCTTGPRMRCGRSVPGTRRRRWCSSRSGSASFHPRSCSWPLRPSGRGGCLPHPLEREPGLLLGDDDVGCRAWALDIAEECADQRADQDQHQEEHDQQLDQRLAFLGGREGARKRSRRGAGGRSIRVSDAMLKGSSASERPLECGGARSLERVTPATKTRAPIIGT